jgi:sodium/hydrogen antiporter
VSFFIAGAVADTVAHSTASLDGALGELGIGVLVGAAVGLGGGALVTFSTRRSWASPAYRGIGALSLALLAYALSIELGGNGFIAAFVGGLAIGSVLPEREQEKTLEFDAQAGELLSLVVWFLFGTALVTALDATTWRTAAFAVLALTVVRMVPVAIALVGCRLTPTTVAFIGWFGPRGLASVVFGLIAFDSLHGSEAKGVLAAVGLTVLASVVAHGLTASPLASRYGALIAALARGAAERAPVPALASRPRSVRRAPRTAITELNE